MAAAPIAARGVVPPSVPDAAAAAAAVAAAVEVDGARASHPPRHDREERLA
jgi:hypothetical protein